MNISHRKILLSAFIVFGMLLTSCHNNIPCPVYAKQGKVTNNQKPAQLSPIKNI